MDNGEALNAPMFGNGGFYDHNIGGFYDHNIVGTTARTGGPVKNFVK